MLQGYGLDRAYLEPHLKVECLRNQRVVVHVPTETDSAVRRQLNLYPSWYVTQLLVQRSLVPIERQYGCRPRKAPAEPLVVVVPPVEQGTGAPVLPIPHPCRWLSGREIGNH